MAEARPPRVPRQRPECIAADMHQRPVVAALEEQIRAAVQALVHEHRQAIRGPDGRDGAELAVVEEAGDLRLRRQTGALAQDVAQAVELHAGCARDDGEGVAILVVDDDRLRHPVPCDMGGVRRSGARVLRRVRDGFIADTLAVEVLPKSNCDCHVRLSGLRVGHDLTRPPQCRMSTGRSACASMWRVTPPKSASRNGLWAYAPMTSMSAPS